MKRKPKAKPRPKAPKAAPARVRKATQDEIEAYYSMRLYHYVVDLDGVSLAMGTLNRAGGRLWGWFDAKEDLTSRQRLAVAWGLMRGLRRISEPVYVTSNEGVHPRAIRLLRTIGFRSTGEHVQGKQIWVYVHGNEDASPLKTEE